MSGMNVFDDATARDLIELVRYKRLHGFWPKPTAKVDRTVVEFVLPYVTNTSGEIIPAYACMQAVGSDEIGEQNYVEVDKPADTDGTSGGYLFNGPYAIEIGGQGVAQTGSVLRAFKNSGTVTAGDEWGPTVNQWYITAGTGSLIAVGEDDVAANVLKIIQAGGGGGGGAVLYRFTLNASLASGTADADILLMDGTDTTIDATVRDPLGIFASLTAVNAPGLCLLQDGLYYVIQAPCPA